MKTSLNAGKATNKSDDFGKVIFDYKFYDGKEKENDNCDINKVNQNEQMAKPGIVSSELGAMIKNTK